MLTPQENKEEIISSYVKEWFLCANSTIIVSNLVGAPILNVERSPLEQSLNPCDVSTRNPPSMRVKTTTVCSEFPIHEDTYELNNISLAVLFKK